MTQKISKVIPALDGMNKEQVYSYLEKIAPHFSTVKIGMEFFYKEGHSALEDIHKNFELGIFLDLKLHDIPNTVSGAIKSLKGLPIDLLTLHLAGGETMIRSALDQAKSCLPNTKLLGVSYLTSLDKTFFKAIHNLEENQIDQAFQRLFSLADKTSIHGIVCSAHELQLCQNHNFLKVCPGIRFDDEISTSKNLGDQKRVMSPKHALDQGADYLVMGRSLSNSENLTSRINELKLIFN